MLHRSICINELSSISLFTSCCVPRTHAMHILGHLVRDLPTEQLHSVLVQLLPVMTRPRCSHSKLSTRVLSWIEGEFASRWSCACCEVAACLSTQHLVEFMRACCNATLLPGVRKRTLVNRLAALLWTTNGQAIDQPTIARVLVQPKLRTRLWILEPITPISNLFSHNTALHTYRLPGSRQFTLRQYRQCIAGKVRLSLESGQPHILRARRLAMYLAHLRLRRRTHKIHRI